MIRLANILLLSSLVSAGMIDSNESSVPKQAFAGFAKIPALTKIPTLIGIQEGENMEIPPAILKERTNKRVAFYAGQSIWKQKAPRSYCSEFYKGDEMKSCNDGYDKSESDAVK